MAGYSVHATEQTAVVGTIEPIATHGSAVLTDAIDLSKHRRIVFYVMGGTIGSSATIDFSVVGSATSGGSYTAITGTGHTITQDVAGGHIHVVEVSTEQVAYNNPTVLFIKGSLTVGTADTAIACLALGFIPRDLPTSNTAAAMGQLVVGLA